MNEEYGDGVDRKRAERAAAMQRSDRPNCVAELVENPHWSPTWSKKWVDLRDPDPATICIEDIAYAHGKEQRWGNHADKHYSVADHCVLLSFVVPPQHALAALLHDAAEAYTRDLPAPVKRHLSGLKELESRLETAIWKALGLPAIDHAAVKPADEMLAQVEGQKFFGPLGGRWKLSDGYDEGVVQRAEMLLEKHLKTYITPISSETAFLKRFTTLYVGERRDLAGADLDESQPKKLGE